MSCAPVYICALWYLDSRGNADYELCESETEAARDAATMDVHGDVSVLGLQFAGGHTVKVDDWPEFAEERRCARERARERATAAPEPPPVRVAYDPFRGRRINIEVTEPAWLGR